MRTTLTLDDDILAAARTAAAKAGRTLKDVVNEALRAGLASSGRPSPRRYMTRGHPMGLQPGYSLDNIQELLGRLDEEERR